jgi:hypothetical protein
MPGRRIATWESIWLALYQQAHTLSLSGGRANALGCAAATIVLAKVSWESYFHEFLERRRLTGDIKRLHFPSDLRTALERLGAPPPRFSKGEPWEQLALLNSLRNAIVHHDATPRVLGAARGDWYKRLIELGVISAASDATWESCVLTPAVARWACTVVGTSIIRAESIPHGRTRSLNSVKEPLTALLESLPSEPS